MKHPSDLAKKYIRIAARDLAAFHAIVNLDSVAEETVGFHGQQIVEKCLKAVLAAYGVEVKKTHDIFELIELLENNSCPLPPNHASLDELTPYAVFYRYDLLETTYLEREELRERVEVVFAWAETCVA